MSARDILLLAAEDAFDFERFREAGPLTADVDPEVTAAEIVEFEALGIPMPSELESLRRELEHAPIVREALRNAAIAMRHSGRATASALVALGPQSVVPAGAYGFGMPGGLPPGVDPRLAAAMAAGAIPHAPPPTAPPSAPHFAQPAPPRARQRPPAEAPPPEPRPPIATAAVVHPEGTVDADILDDWDGAESDFDDDDDWDAPRPKRPRRRPKPKSRRPRDHGYDDDDFDDDDDLLIAAPPARDDKTTWILGGIAAAAVLALLWIGFGNRGSAAQTQAQADPALAPNQAVNQPPVQQAVPAAVAPPPAALPPAEAAPPPAPAQPASTGGGGRRGGGGSRGGGGGGGSKPAPKSSPLNPFGGYTPPGENPAPAPTNGQGGAQPGTQPGTQPAPAPAPAGGGAQPGTQPGTQPAPAPAPAEGGAQPAPAPTPEEPKPEEPKLVKQKMTAAQRGAITKKVGDLQRCYTDALVGKPDLAGRVVFTISLDQDGVVKRVDIAKDQVKYGVAKCAAKKIRSWTLPSGGIPMIFDLPFDFKQ
ncbi:hypothetical protein PPSIR1_28761 [Plesiocystis pacifica SIR-1]|uniref:Uncharacterized protein n=1 Tax=Plesiocystis pacifica SIR-1 TaxID=391625 RepID=A6GEI9_9BACT|nr:AgmX/PglI C-terminal domain-containing protein [Plesiocystis pacifica]EDM75697.1 hypothetical protein PPSIR1_28761 [Plesiocystis pacifica SIR-1]